MSSRSYSAMAMAQANLRDQKGDLPALTDSEDAQHQIHADPTLDSDHSENSASTTSTEVSAETMPVPIAIQPSAASPHFHDPAVKVEGDLSYPWEVSDPFSADNIAQSSKVGCPNPDHIQPYDNVYLTQNALSYHANFHQLGSLEYSSNAFTQPYHARSYPGFESDGRSRNINMADLYPPGAYQIAPVQPHCDAAIEAPGHDFEDPFIKLQDEYEMMCYDMDAMDDRSEYQSQHSAMTPSTPYDSDDGVIDKDQPYAQLIYKALYHAPNRTMILREIYDWFRKNTDKGRSPESKGWMNSIRHNLSMNGAFQKVDQPCDDARKGFMWRLTDEAVRDGVKSTTRFRHKHPNKRTARSQSRHQRQASGTKGGHATRRAARSNRSYPAAEAPPSRSVPAGMQATYTHDHQAMLYPPSPSVSDHDFQYECGDSGYTGSLMGTGFDMLGTSPLLAPDTGRQPSAYMVAPGLNHPHFMASPSPSLDEPRTPDSSSVWPDDVGVATPYLEDSMFNSDTCLQEFLGQ